MEERMSDCLFYHTISEEWLDAIERWANHTPVWKEENTYEEDEKEKPLTREDLIEMYKRDGTLVESFICSEELDEEWELPFN